MLSIIAFAVAACAGPDVHLLDPNPGGDATTELNNRAAFSQPIPGLSDEERLTFEIGNAFFDATWTPAGEESAATDGLGPLFAAASCGACHARDGRGSPEGEGFVLRVGATDGSPLDGYGSQIQRRGVTGVPPEASVVVSYTEEPGAYLDGAAFSLRVPAYTLEAPGYGSFGSFTSSPRVAPATFGVGLIEAIPEDSLLAGEDPDDANGDGISGRANRLGDGAVGRFGLKASVPTVEAQVALAFHRDLGITSPAFPNENCTTIQTACAASPSGGEPELTNERLQLIVAYVSTLAVPKRRNLDEAPVVAGASLFESLQCDLCHTPSFRTGDHGIGLLTGQLITPFSDFLLHDMGEGLADGKLDGSASGSEWRTAPLWGLGLVEEVSGHSFLLHDGRARSIEEAILWHGGEATASRDGFIALSAEDRRRLVAFLESL